MDKKRLSQNCEGCGSPQNWYVELDIVPANESKLEDINGTYCFDCAKSILEGAEVKKRKKENEVKPIPPTAKAVGILWHEL